jgi:hypothetical protein
MTNTPILPLFDILDGLGYLPIASKVDSMIYTSVIDSINILGKSFSKALVYNICKFYRLSEYELLTNYSLFESSLFKILGKKANSIITRIRKDILIKAVLLDPSITKGDILNSSLTINDIIFRMRLVEISALIQGVLTHSSHILFLYDDLDNKRKILSAFFDSHKINDTKNILYPSRCSSKHQGLVSSYGIYNPNIETAYSLSHDKTKRYLEAPRNKSTVNSRGESSSPRKVVKSHEISILCECNITNLVNQNMESNLRNIVVSHDYVIFDKPLTIYKSRDIRNNLMRQLELTKK